MGPATDTYALGAVLYEMLTGDPPYMGSTAQAVLGQIIAGEAVSATKKRASVPANVDAVLRCVLEKLPADRFATAREFVRALGDPAFRYGESVAAAPGGNAARGWLLGVAGLAIGIAAGIYFAGADRSSEELSPVRFSFHLAETSDLWSTRNYAAVAISRDGSTIGYAAQTSQRGGQFLRPLSGRDFRSYVSGQWTYGPFFGPAGERMAYVVDGTRLEAVGADGAGRVTLATFQTNANSGRWGPDGSIVVSLGEHGLVRVSPASATQDTLTRPDSAAGEVAHEWPEFLPGGESLLFTIRYDDGSDSISVLSLTDGKIRRGIIEGAHGTYVPTGHLVFGRDDGIFVAPFDAEGASVTGPLERMVENLASGGAVFDVSDTGMLVYEPRSTRVRRLFWVDEDGGATTLPLEPAEYFAPRLSPDGRRIGVGIGGQVYDIWSIDVSSGAARQLAFTGQSESLVWGPDGRYAYYTVEASGVIHRIDADGSNHVEIASDIGRLDAHPADVSPDGAWLAVNGWNEAGPGASALNLETGQVIPISDPNDGTGQEAAFSPDGALVAYTNVATDGTYRVVVRTFLDTRAGRWNVGEPGASSPLWAPDGSRIFVRYGTRLAQIPITLTPTFDFGSSSDLFDGPYTWNTGEAAYDYDPVGRRFLMVESPAPVEIMVVLNWFTELRERMGGS